MLNGNEQIEDRNSVTARSISIFVVVDGLDMRTRMRWICEASMWTLR